MFVDTHAHLYFDDFDRDREEVVHRAKAEGIVRVLLPAVDNETGKQAIELANAHPEIYAAVGVHPNSSRNWHDSLIEELHSLARSAKVVAIGEIGLDYYRDYAPKEQQWSVLQNQLKLAAELSLPVVLHTRDHPQRDGSVFSDMLALLKEWVQELARSGNPLKERPGVFHSFSGSLETAGQVVEMGFMLGISGPITFPNATRLRQVVSQFSLSNILIETDAPFLTPQKFRGKRNEPAYVKLVAEKIAELHSQLLEDVGRITTENAQRLFNW